MSKDTKIKIEKEREAFKKSERVIMVNGMGIDRPMPLQEYLSYAK